MLLDSNVKTKPVHETWVQNSHFVRGLILVKQLQPANCKFAALASECFGKPRHPMRFKRARTLQALLGKLEIPTPTLFQDPQAPATPTPPTTLVTLTPNLNLAPKIPSRQLFAPKLPAKNRKGGPARHFRLLS